MTTRVIGRHSIVAEVLRQYPASGVVFERYGFTQESDIGDNEEQWVPAGDATIEAGAALYGADLEQLLDDLNQAAAAGQAADGGLLPKLESVLNTLKTCFDPEIPLDIVDLGLVYDIRLNGTAVEVDLARTSRDCQLTPHLVALVEAKLRDVPGVESVLVRLVWDPPWSLQRLSEFARRRLGYV